MIKSNYPEILEEISICLPKKWDSIKRHSSIDQKNELYFYYKISLQTFEKIIDLERIVIKKGFPYQKFLKETSLIKKQMDFLVYSFAHFLYIYFNLGGTFNNIEEEYEDITSVFWRFKRDDYSEFFSKILKENGWVKRKDMEKFSQ